jgi:HPr kinase/phosphorylase
MTRTINLHANCVLLTAPVTTGILILGDSGSGKSDLTLRLIDQGALLVADDRTELFVETGKLKARAPAALAGLIEIRGIGIVALPYEKTAQIGLVVQLAARSDIPRLPEPALYTPPPLALPDAARPPLIQLDPLEPSATAKLRWAAYAFFHGAFRSGGNTP